MDSKQTDIETDEVIEENLTEEEESEGVEAAMRTIAHRRGAAKPVGAFARSDWYWTWSKGVDLLDAVFIDAHPEYADEARADVDAFALKLARDRMEREVDEICNAVSWNISEYRKIFHITITELSRAIDVSESTLRKKLNEGTLTLREFLTLCSVCLTDPCVVLGYVDSEDANLVRNIHYLDKASDHRAVGEFVQILSHKQNGRTMIRQSVSPAIEADMGWSDDPDDDDGLPEWPLWWQTSFDYTVFNNLIIEYLRSVKHIVPWKTTYEMKAEAASELIKLLQEDPELRSKYDQVLKVRSTISSLQLNDCEEQAESLKSVESAIYVEFLKMLESKAGEAEFGGDA